MVEVTKVKESINSFCNYFWSEEDEIAARAQEAVRLLRTAPAENRPATFAVWLVQEGNELRPRVAEYVRSLWDIPAGALAHTYARRRTSSKQIILGWLLNALSTAGNMAKEIRRLTPAAETAVQEQA